MLRVMAGRKVERLLLARPSIAMPLGLSYGVFLRGLLDRLRVLIQFHYGSAPRGHPDIIRYEFLAPVHRVESLAFPTRLRERVAPVGGLGTPVKGLHPHHVHLRDPQFVMQFHVLELKIRYFPVFLADDGQVLLLVGE